MNIIRSILLASTAVGLAACGADDVASPGEGTLVVVTPAPAPAPAPTPSPSPTPTPSLGNPATTCPTGTSDGGLINVGGIASNQLRVCELSGTYDADLTLADLPGLVYSLDDVVLIGEDVGFDGNAAGGVPVTLTIEPGVVIYGSSGADALVIRRGSQINAVGTPTNPIIFTSESNMLGTAGPDTVQQWGGLIVLGRAPQTDCTVDTSKAPGDPDCEAFIEGLAPGTAIFGGATETDNSGTMQYVQVRFGGFEFNVGGAGGNELNGISLGGVGSGTTFDHIQVHNNFDDGIEWFGGNVSGSHYVLTGIGDDSLDVDVGYKGAAQFVYVRQRATSGNHMIEGDSNSNPDDTPRTNFVISNATFVGDGSDIDALLLRGNMDATLVNSIVTTATAGECLDLDGPGIVDPANPATDELGPPDIRSTFFACAGGPSDVDDGAAAQAEIDTVIAADANNVPNGTSTLIDGLFAGANEQAVTTVDPTTIDPRFVAANYIGAFEDQNDTWFAGWTCGVGGGVACENPPIPAASSGN